jgi:hypothetical protein
VSARRISAVHMIMRIERFFMAINLSLDRVVYAQNRTAVFAGVLF